ncbi:MAG TPA: hypothetical protein VHM20_03010 [Gammaproteobacteria bacterium]|jgi:hypothetical protein|nr:hypothetical protein [Gammaproteobacteria bacterium]
MPNRAIYAINMHNWLMQFDSSIRERLGEHTDANQFIEKLLNYFSGIEIQSSKLSQARNQVYAEAKILLESGNITPAEKQTLAESIVNAIHVVNNPLNIDATKDYREMRPKFPVLLKH